MSRPAPPEPDLSPFALSLRRFRTARRMSQLELALQCEISARHLSFLETGKASPSRDMVLGLAHGLSLPESACNQLLHAAGFAAIFPEHALDSAELEPFRAILSEMLARHEPYPALVCDRHWTIRDANTPARALLIALHGPQNEMNMIRMVTGHPDAETLIVNYADVLRELLHRLEAEAAQAVSDATLEALIGLIRQKMGALHLPEDATTRQAVVPLILNMAGQQLKFLTAIAHFGTTRDVTIRDLRLELMFPADEATRAALTGAG